MINIENLTCEARDLAELLGMTPRNILHMVDRGMPVSVRGKAGKGHVFKVPWALHWWGGWRSCQHHSKALPGPLETVLIGYGLCCRGPGFKLKE